ncbi:MAG TPA: hypothetical protein VIE17_00125 [Methylophilaceae bacterium]|jgi:hypothetical protein
MQATDTEHPEFDIYVGFGRLVDRAAAWLDGAAVSVLDKEAIDVSRRLTQRLIEMTFMPFAQSTKQRSVLRHDIRLAGIAIDPEMGGVKLSLAALCRALVEYSAHWGLALVAILAGFLPHKNTAPATLVYGVDISKPGKNSDERFVDYCRNGPIQPLKDAGRLLIQSTVHQGILSNARWQYAKYPHLILVAEGRLGIYRRIRLLLTQLVAPLGYLNAVLRFPPMALLGRDFGLAPIMQALIDAHLIESCVITNSTGKVQPLWMRGKRNFAVHMVWYSQNTRLHQYKNQAHEAQNPHIPYVTADVHWVWTEGYRDHLARILKTQGDIRVVGPILWYLPEALSIKLERPCVAVFDVIPVTADAAFKLGIPDSYFSPRNAQKFLTDIVEACNSIGDLTGERPQIYLKHKREAASPLFDRSYLDLVSELASSGQICLLDPGENIFGMLAASDLCVAIPYTSPVHVATSVGTPAIYYDPTQSLQSGLDQATDQIAEQGPEQTQGLHSVHFIAEREQLETTIMNWVAGVNSVKVRTAND